MGGGNNLQILGNTIAGNGIAGLYLSGYNVQIDNNILVENAGGGLYFYSGNGVLRHNTIADNGGVAGVRVDYANPLTLTNTIIAGHGYGLRTMDPSANVQADHTLWFNNSHDMGASGGVNIVTTNNVYGDPAFVGGTDPFVAYHLTASSAALDAGVETILTTDIDGEQRALDIGADEYPYVLNLIPDYRRTTEPDTSITYTHSLRNSGSLTDTVSLSAISSQGWNFSLTPTTATLGSGQTITVTLIVNVPAGVDGVADTTLITATSTSSPGVSASAQDVTLVGIGVSLDPNYEQNALPGETLVYSHTLTNLGSVADSFSLSLSSERGWATLLSASPVSLAAGESTVMVVQVQVPLTATVALVDTAIVAAASTTVPEVYDTAVDVTMVAANQGTRYVAPTGYDSENSCLVSSVPCQTVGWAVEQAGSGDVIKIATGIYTNPDMNVEGRLVVLDQTVTLAGGYTAQDWDNPDPVNNPSILDGQNLGTVVYAETGGITVTLSGLQIQGGLYEAIHIQNARLVLTGSQVLNTTNGYGIYLTNSDGSQILNNQVTGNYYGLQADTSDYLTISGSTFSNISWGVNLSYNNTYALLEGNTFTGNSQYGVHVYYANYYATFRTNVIQNNGNGVYYSYAANDNGLFENNVVTGNGQGIYAVGYGNSQITFRGNVLTGNTGYGLYWGYGHNLQVLGNTIAGNGNVGLYLSGNNQQVDNNILANNAGGGLYFYNGTGVLRHNTIADNGGVAGVRVDYANPISLVNNIIAGHSYGLRTMDPYANVQADHTLWFNNTQNINSSAGGTIITTNDFFANPLFVGGPNAFEAYHISESSPAIDLGALVELPEDIDRQPRPTGTGYDIGADEFPGTPAPPTGLALDGPTSGTVNTLYTFDAFVAPITTTPPITYAWWTDRNAPIIHVDGLNDSVQFLWNTPGLHVITATATNAGGVLTSTHVITLAPPVAAGFPFYDGFEAGTLASGWMVVTTKQGRVQVNTTAPYQGAYSVLLDDSVGDNTYSTAALILNVDLTGQSGVVLDFWWREFIDENHLEDGVFISDDYGDTWYQVLSFNNGPSTYRRDFINLDGAAAANGLTFNDHFQIKFQYYDNHAVPNDGYAIDEVRLVQADPVESVVVDGPSTGLTGGSYTFTATVSPITATPPIEYVWMATGLSPVTHTGGLSDQVTFAWETPGTKSITVTAINAAGTAVGNHVIEIEAASAISAAPTAFNVTQDAGLITTQSLVISNNALGTLEFNLSLLNGIVAVEPLSGTILGNSQQTITVTFDTTTLDPGTYTDRIDISSNDPVTSLLSIPVNLTVVLIPPEAPANPNPQDGAVDVSVDNLLTWDVTPHATSYDLYLWEDGAPTLITPTVSGLTQPAFDPPGDLATGTQFHWQVMARNQAGETPGPEWTFTTETLPDLLVSAVEVPTSTIAGQQLEISWTALNDGDGETETSWTDQVYLSADGTFEPGTDLYLGQVTSLSNLLPGESYTQTASFLVPADISGTYFVFVGVDGPGNVQESDENNNISAPAGPVQIQSTPADVVVSKTSLAPSNTGLSDDTALAGYPITYTLTLANNGQLIATQVVATDTLPGEVVFISESSGLPFSQNGGLLSWAVGDLAYGESVVIKVVGEVLSGTLGTITNQLVATTESPEANLSNNTYLLDTTVEAPAPVLALSPTGPTLAVDQGGNAILVATVSNLGTAEMTGITISSPPYIPWVTINPATLGDLMPGASGTFTITANVGLDQIPGYYRDFVVVSDASGNQEAIALTVQVIPPTRTVSVTITNDQGLNVPEAVLSLVKQEASVLVTEGVTQTYHVSVQGVADASGVIALPNLEVGAYDYTLSAADHSTVAGTITVVEGTGIQTETLLIVAQSELAISPQIPVIGVVQGETEGMTIQVLNNGAAPLSGLSVSAPTSLPWVYLVTPDPFPSVPPGTQVDFTIFASPPLTQAVGIYQDYVTVSSAGGQAQQIALTVEVTSDQVRDLEVFVTDDAGAPVTDGTVTLVEQALTIQSIGGLTTTFNQQYSAQLDATGLAQFTALQPGDYNYLVTSQGFDQGVGTETLAFGSGPQVTTIALTPAPFTYNWQVVPIQQGYNITLTLTYDTQAADAPYMVIPFRVWNFDICTLQPINDVITLYNMSPITLTLESLSDFVLGTSVQFGVYPSTIGPNASVSIPVTATQAGVPAAGTILASFTYQAVADEFVTFTFNPSSMTSPLLQSGQAFSQTYTISPVVFDPGTLYSLQVTQPSSLDWIALSPGATGPMNWNENTEIPVTLFAAPPTWLPEGTYTDSALIRVTGDDGTWREGYLNIEVTRTADGFQVHTSFELGPIPFEEKSGTAAGIILPGLLGCGTGGAGGGGGWSWIGGGGSLVGTKPGSSNTTPPSFPQYIPPPLNYYDHQQVQLEISQKLMLEGEGFNAMLSLDNTSASPLEDVSVDIVLTDLNGSNQTASFTIVPEVPTDLGTVPVGGSTSGDWLILPTALGVISPTGEAFNVKALIHYTWNGVEYTEETLPELITVYPAPDLVITYELPLADCVYTEFNMKVTITNQGEGPARNLQFSSAQPMITDNVTGLPIGFQITEAFVNGVSQGPSLNLNLGDLEPGATIEVVWRIVSSIPGRFVEFTSDYKQSNYQGLTLTPLVSEINTVFSSANCTFSVFGQVMDSDGTPIAGVNISTVPISSKTTSANGEYIFKNLSAGTYTINPSKIGYTFSPSSTVITGPPDAIGVDFTAIPTTATKPVVVLVHGFQGLSEQSDMNCDPNNINQEPKLEIIHWGEIITDEGKSDAVNYWAAMPAWLNDDYDVWIAQLKTGGEETPPLLFNAKCLANQIAYVYKEEQLEQKGQKITIIAHSMGGLVSRACLSKPACGEMVDKLVTLGSPHAGLPVKGLSIFLVQI